MKHTPSHLRMFYCMSEAEHNNGLVKRCGFSGKFDNSSGFSYNCPTCNTVLSLLPDGPSISDLLQRGLSEEKDRLKSPKA
jgi:hypothetical protein